MTELIDEPLSAAEYAQRERIRAVIDRWLDGHDLPMWDVHPIGDAGLYFCELRAHPKGRLQAFVPWSDMRHSSPHLLARGHK